MKNFLKILVLLIILGLLTFTIVHFEKSLKEKNEIVYDDYDDLEDEEDIVYEDEEEDTQDDSIEIEAEEENNTEEPQIEVQ